MNGRELAERLNATGLLEPGELQGCSEADISELEQRTGLQLPEAYRDFLRAVGQNPGALMSDCEFGFDNLADIDAFARSMLFAYCGDRLRLPESAFVWESRAGEQFMFFLADGKSDDPPVFHYFEDQTWFEEVASSIWVPIEQELTFLEECVRRWPPDDPFWDTWWRYGSCSKRRTPPDRRGA